MSSTDDLSRLKISRDLPSARSTANTSRRKTLVIGAVAALILAVAVFALLSREETYDVRVATAAARGGGSGGGGLTANGYVVARTKASVSSKVPGRLVFLGVEEGDRVEAGAVIARLEAAEFEAIVRQAASEVLAAEATRQEAEATVAQAERDLARARELSAAGLIARRDLEDAETALSVARSRLGAFAARVEAARQNHAAARANLENTLVRAPFSGTVLRKDAEVGEVVAPSVGGGLTRGAVVTMADLSTLEVEVDVNEAYISGIRDNQPAEIVLDAYPTETFPGRVRQVVPTADRQKATVLVRVLIDSRDPRIMPEMGARVVFREQPDSAGAARPSVTRVFVPAAAVRSDAGSDIVFVVTEGRVARRAITAGPVSGDEREVRSGLSGGETLVLDPPTELSDGARVRIVTNTNAESN